ncbi:MAG: hypothetical protein ACPL4E_05480 [Thermoproteota archaeon]
MPVNEDQSAKLFEFLSKLLRLIEKHPEEISKWLTMKEGREIFSLAFSFSPYAFKKKRWE